MSVTVDVDVASIVGYRGKTLDEKVQDAIVRDDNTRRRDLGIVIPSF